MRRVVFTWLRREFRAVSQRASLYTLPPCTRCPAPTALQGHPMRATRLRSAMNGQTPTKRIRRPRVSTWARSITCLNMDEFSPSPLKPQRALFAQSASLRPAGRLLYSRMLLGKPVGIRASLRIGYNQSGQPRPTRRPYSKVSPSVCKYARTILDDLEAEPSSVLGSRILRALDNPSPPPQLDNLPVDSEDEDEHVTDISPLLQPAASVSAHRLASANPPETAPFEDLQGALSDFEGGQLGSVGPMDEDIVPPQPELIPSDLASTPPAQTSATLVLTESEETAVYKGLTGPSEELLDPMAVDEAPVTPVVSSLPLTSEPITSPVWKLISALADWGC